MEKVSVIIPVYNAALTIERCVDSLLCNTYPSIEIILVDDCSKDESLRICEMIALKYNDAHIIVCHNSQNSGVSYTRNVGLKCATGHFFCFVDSDDWVEDTYIETLVAAVTDQRSDIALCGFINHDEKFNASTESYLPVAQGKEEIFTIGSVLINLYHSRLLQQLWNNIFLADLIRKNNILFDESISMGEDFRFVLEYLHILGSNAKIALVGQSLYHYIRDNANSLMSRFGKDSIQEPVKNLESMIDLLPENEIHRQQVFIAEKEVIIEQYTYHLIHNSSYSIAEKWRIYKTFQSKINQKLFFRMYAILIKEGIRKFIS